MVVEYCPQFPEILAVSTVQSWSSLRFQHEQRVDHGVTKSKGSRGELIENIWLNLGVITRSLGYKETVLVHILFAQDSRKILSVYNVLHLSNDNSSALLVESLVVLEVLRQIFLQLVGDSVVFPHEDDVHGCQERMLIDSVVPGHKVLLCLGSQQIPVRSEVELLLGWRLVGDLVDGQKTVLVCPEDGGVLLAAPVNIGSVHEGGEFIVLLSHGPLTHRGGADKVEAGGGEVDPGVEPVPGGDGNGEALRVAQTGLGTTIKAFCKRKIIICGNLVMKTSVCTFTAWGGRKLDISQISK